MRRLLATSLVALMFTSAPALADGHMADKKAMHDTGHHAEKSLYERLGGQPAVSAVIDDFAGRVLADTRINAKFAKSDPARLVHNLKTFVCSATGGPCKYEGQDMKAAHKNMAVTNGEFGALVEDLVATLDKFKVPEKEKGELLAALGPLGPQIVEDPSTATGGKLPEVFKPAPPLKTNKM